MQTSLTHCSVYCFVKLLYRFNLKEAFVNDQCKYTERIKKRKTKTNDHTIPIFQVAIVLGIIKTNLTLNSQTKSYFYLFKNYYFLIMLGNGLF